MQNSTTKSVTMKEFMKNILTEKYLNPDSDVFIGKWSRWNKLMFLLRRRSWDSIIGHPAEMSEEEKNEWTRVLNHAIPSLTAGPIRSKLIRYLKRIV